MDWEPVDVVAALHKAGWSLRRLSFAHGYASNALKHALRRPYPAAERAIAGAIGVAPETIWPSRYGRTANLAKGSPGAAAHPCTHGDEEKDTTLGE